MSSVCKFYHLTPYSRWSAATSDFIKVEVPECWGQKGAPECNCQGEPSKCQYSFHHSDSAELFHLEFKFVGYQPVSANDMYIPTARKRKKGGGFGGAFLRKSWQLEKWQNTVREAFSDEVFYSKEYIRLIASYINDQNVGTKFTLKVSIPKEDYWNEANEFELYRNDTSNFIKAIEDSIFSNVGIDDKRTIKLEVEKGYNEDYVWYIEAHLIGTSIDNKIDVDTRRAKINGEN